MNRRVFLSSVVGGASAATAGCLDRVLGGESDDWIEDIDFEETDRHDPDTRPPETSPEISVDGPVITVTGDIEHGSTDCGTVEVAHADYERTQQRLDLLIVAGDQPDFDEPCQDDVRNTGYQAEVTVDEQPKWVSVSEHHTHGDTTSTVADLTNS